MEEISLLCMCWQERQEMMPLVERSIRPDSLMPNWSDWCLCSLWMERPSPGRGMLHHLQQGLIHWGGVSPTSSYRRIIISLAGSRKFFVIKSFQYKSSDWGNGIDVNRMLEREISGRRPDSSNEWRNFYFQFFSSAMIYKYFRPISLSPLSEKNPDKEVLVWQ